MLQALWIAQISRNWFSSKLPTLWIAPDFWCLPPSFCHRRMRKTDLKLILTGPSSWPDLTTIKQRKDQRKLFHDDDTISALMSSSGNKGLRVVISVRMRRHTGEDADVVVVTLIFNRAVIEKTIPPCPLAVTREEEEINPQNQETLAWRDHNPKDSIY